MSTTSLFHFAKSCDIIHTHKNALVIHMVYSMICLPLCSGVLPLGCSVFMIYKVHTSIAVCSLFCVQILTTVIKTQHDSWQSIISNMNTNALSDTYLCEQCQLHFRQHKDMFTLNSQTNINHCCDQ